MSYMEMASLGEYDSWNNAKQAFSVAKDIAKGEEDGSLYLVHGINRHLFPYDHCSNADDKTCVRKLYCAGKCPPYFDPVVGRVSTVCPWTGYATVFGYESSSASSFGNEAVHLDSHFPLMYSISAMPEVDVEPLRPISFGEWFRCRGHMHLVDSESSSLPQHVAETIEMRLHQMGDHLVNPETAWEEAANILEACNITSERVDLRSLSDFLVSQARALPPRVSPMIDLVSDSEECFIDLTEEQADVVLLDSSDDSDSSGPTGSPAVEPPLAKPTSAISDSETATTTPCLVKFDLEARTKLEEFSAQSIEEDRRAAGLREDLSSSHAAGDFARCVVIVQELLTFSPRFLRKPWASFMKIWDIYYTINDMSFTVLYGLRELLVTNSREIGDWDLFNSTCAMILQDDGAPHGLVMQTVAYQINRCLASGGVSSVAILLKSLEANPRFRLAVRSLPARGEKCGFSDAALARAYFEVELFLPSHKHAVRALTDSLEPDEKFWCLLISLYCQPQLKSSLSTRQQISRWRDFLRDVPFNTDLAFDHYLNWLLAVEPNCVTKHEYAAVISELKWVTSDDAVDPRSLSYLKALKRIIAFKCQGDSSWLERSVDATRVGNEARYANHSDDPNCCLDSTPAIIALKPIAAGDEITVNYGPEYWRWLPSSAEDEEDLTDCSYTGSIVEEPPFGLDHGFSVRNKSIQGNVYFKVETCPRSHPAYPGKRLLACRQFLPGDTVIIYAGVRSSRPELFSMLCSSMHTARTDSGVVRGAFGFILNPSKSGYMAEQAELPVFASLLSASAGDLRDWSLLPDLTSVKEIKDLGYEATAILVKMLMSKRGVTTFQNWVKGDAPRSELKLKLLRYGAYHREPPPKLELLAHAADDVDNTLEENKSRKRKEK